MSSLEASRAKTSGVLSIIAGAIFIVSMIFGVFLLWAIFDMFTGGSGNPDSLPTMIIPLFILPPMLFGIVAIIGGIAAMHHRNWALALTGSICSIICVWFLGIPAIILLLKAKEAFFVENAAPIESPT